jgi:hypothetical protein
MTDTTETGASATLAAKSKPAKPQPAAPEFTPELAGLDNVIEDARRSALDSDAGPDAPTDYATLLEAIEAGRAAFPPLYEQEFVDPFDAALKQLGRTRFTQILAQDPQREGSAGLLMDMSQAVLQRAEKYSIAALNAFQEVIGDLYDGFLSAEDRRGVKPPDRGVTPPLVKFGNPASGPYTWPIDATSTFGAKAAVVNLPPANASVGLVAWAALGHETAGHDILHADTGLQPEIADAMHAKVATLNGFLADYWASRIDETAADVMGLLNMGPAAGIGLVGYFRGLNKAFTGKAVLRRVGPDDDPHPCDVLRGYLAASVIRRLSFDNAAGWAAAIEAEADKDAGVSLSLAGTGFAPSIGKATADLVADAIVTTKLTHLDGHALIEIQDWANEDEAKVATARRSLVTAVDLPPTLNGTPIYAAHVVAAAVMEALSKAGAPADLKLLQDRMISLLGVMHAKNPAWGPLFVRHPGDLKRDFAYLRRVYEEADPEPVVEAAKARR